MHAQRYLGPGLLSGLLGLILPVSVLENLYNNGGLTCRRKMNTEPIKSARGTSPLTAQQPAER